MNLIDRIRRKYFYGTLNIKLKLLRYNKKIANLDKIKDILILFDATEEKDVAIVKGYYDKLTNRKKNVDLVGFVSTRKPVIFNFAWFGYQHTNWFYKPKGKEITRFINKEYDLLINASLHECLPLEYITALSHAAFKAGPYFDDKHQYYDLMPNLNDKEDLITYFNLLDNYLNIVNKEKATVLQS